MTSTCTPMLRLNMDWCLGLGPAAAVPPPPPSHTSWGRSRDGTGDNGGTCLMK